MADASGREARRRAQTQVGEFLAARRAEIGPEEAGLPTGIGRRRVPGLRREEVALLAGISVEYYARLERGAVGDVSPQVVAALGSALRLAPVEREHLNALLRTASGHTAEPPPATSELTPQLHRLLALLEPAAAFIRNGRLDLLACNATAAVLYAAALDHPRPNLARYLFTDGRSRTSYADWDSLADNAVGTLRAEFGRHPHDAELTALVAELTAASPEFAQRWNDHEVRRYRAGRQGFRLPDGAVVELDYEALGVVGSPGLTLLVYSAEPDSDAARRLEALARPL